MWKRVCSYAHCTLTDYGISKFTRSTHLWRKMKKQHQQIRKYHLTRETKWSYTLNCTILSNCLVFFPGLGWRMPFLEAWQMMEWVIMITTGKTGQEWRFCSDLSWRSFYVVPDRSSRRKAEPTFSPHPTSAHIYALGVSAVSHRTLMCFKEVSLDLPPILPPSLFLSLSRLQHSPRCWSAGFRCAQTRSAFRLLSTPDGPPSATLH